MSIREGRVKHLQLDLTEDMFCKYYLPFSIIREEERKVLEVSGEKKGGKRVCGKVIKVNKSQSIAKELRTY